MLWRSLVCVGFAIIGLVLFLYGGNYYNVLFGWTGVYIMIGSVVAAIVLTIWERLKKDYDD